MFSSSQSASEHHQSDFQILSGIIGGLRQHKPHVKSCKKAAVALILRMEGDDLDGLSKTHQFSNSSDAEIVEQFLGTSLAQHGRLELLYMKRTANPGDTWSGHVSFPGGRQQESDTDDRDTAIREVYEEVGVSLAPTQHPTRPAKDADTRFVCVGRLDDRQVFGGGAAVTGFAMCAFVFLQVDNKPVRFTMQQKEVSAVLWAPVRMLHPASVHFSEVVLPYRILALQNWLPESINHRLGLDTLCFPSIALHELKNVVVCHQRQLDPGTPGEEFVLWGMTLRATSALVHFVDVPRLDWPPATVNNRVLNWVVQIVASCMRYTNPDVVRRWHG